MLYKAVPSRNGEGRRVTMEPLFSFFLISRGSIRKYAHYYYLLQAKVQLSIIFSASFWIFHSRLILKWKKNVLTSFATRRVLAGEISTFPCLVWELHLYWNHIYPCMYTLYYIWKEHCSFSVLKFKLEKILLQVTKCTQEYYKYQHLWVRKCWILV